MGHHDTCAAALPAALADIEAGRLADRVVVVRRAGEVLYTNERVPGGRWQRPAGAREVLLAERARPWSAAETGAFRRRLADADRRAHDPRLPEDWSLAVRRDAERAAALAEPLRRTAQARRAAPGTDYHRLSAEEHRWIFDELIVPDLLARITPQEQPIVVYVMGQPGAGKTGMTPMLRRTLRGRPVRISGDDFKAAHPDYLQLLEEEPRTAGERIRADYRAWQALAEQYVRERRSDAVVETAPVSAAAFVNGAMLYRRAGYRVKVVVPAVRAADSLQGTAERYAQVSSYGVAARFTTTGGHDTHFAALSDAVAVAERTGVADAVTVLRRDATVATATNAPPMGTGHVRPVLPLLCSSSSPAPTPLLRPHGSGPRTAGCAGRCRTTAMRWTASPSARGL
ncbi:zeta toxin family protein [Streptomyces sp. NBC_01243]|uniref:zeta toxin family protein n=1 Tax=Streptomyces sp. NBC_01243 TaxID=2903796 RepID=UPI002E122A75|nr:zeta toxin family protein [Streptomyces sp. NBC_01243]